MTDRKLVGAFLKDLKKEIDFWGKKLRRVAVKTVYFGGGTPSILSVRDFQKIVGWLKENFKFSRKLEFSLEANPETISEKKLKIWKQLGVNRISLGVQTFSDKFLKILGRVHNSEKSFQAIKLVKKYFQNFNLDLMFGLPGQTLKEFKNDLEKALSFKPAHLSIYQLTPEKNTPLFNLLKNKKLTLPDEETLFKMYQSAIQILSRAGFKHYEISNFCRPGQACQHNLAVWHFEPYLGLGPGAHSFLNNQRFANPKNIFLRTLRPRRQTLSQNALMSEFMFLGLRLLKGIPLKKFKKLFGADLKKIYHLQIEKLKKQKLLKIQAGRLSLTKKGIFLGNEVFEEFV